MSERRWLRASERWISLLLHLYPIDFRDDVGRGITETYLDRCRATLRDRGVVALLGVWLRAFGDSLRNGLGERLRPGIDWRQSGNWGRDTERAIRRLVRAPVFALTITATLTIGLGAFAVVYAVVDTILLEPLPYRRADDLYYVWRDYRKFFDLDRGWLGGTDVAALQQAGGVITDAAALLQRNVTLSRTPSANGGAGADPEEIPMMMTTPNLFDLLGVRPAIGRGFAPDESEPGKATVAVLTHALWQRRFAGDPRVIGSEVRLNGTPYTVIGVMGEDFHFVRHASIGSPQGADVYVPLAVNLARTNPGNGSYAGLVRVRAGTPPAQVTAAVATVSAMVDRRDFQARGLRLYPVGMREDLIKPVRPALIVLAASGVVLVLVLGINLATLLLVRAAKRDQEFAVLRALGASRVALVRATLLESTLLGSLGGACAALAAAWGTRALVALAPLDLPRRESIAVDWQVAAVVIGVGIAVGLIAGAVPAIWATRTRLSTLMGIAAVRGGGGGHGRLRRSLVVAQVALCLVLLSVGGLVARSFEHLLRARPGFDTNGLLTLRIPVTRARYPDSTAVTALHTRVERALAAIPGVTAVGAASALPLTSSGDQTAISIPRAPGNTGQKEHDQPLVDYTTTRSGYLEAMRIPLVEGRTFGPATPGNARDAVIDRSLASIFFPSSSALGARLVYGQDTLTVIGVVEHARMNDVHKDGRPQLYVRNETYTYNSLYFVVRSARELDALAGDVRRAVHDIDPQLAVAAVTSMDRVVAESLRQPKLSAVLIGGFSLGALVLAAMGLFGVIASTVNYRRHELAVRLALGSDHRGVLRLVLGEGARLIIYGLLLGVPGVYVAGRAVRGTLVGISPFDPLTLGAVALALGVVGIIACYVPARRTTEIEPAALLRQG